MKKIIFTLVLFSSFFSNAQIYDPVTWSTSVKKISDTEYELIAEAIIADNWHLYSQFVPEDGPLPTTFSFEGNANYLKKGNTKEEKGHVVDDPIFDMEIKYFESKATFAQRIKLRGKKGFKINAVVEFMVCNNTQCLPPKEQELTFEIK